MNVKTGERVAVKILKEEVFRDAKRRKQLQREITVMHRLKSRHIVHLLEVYNTGKRLYLVLELCTGGELFDHIIDVGRFPESTARRYFQQLLAGVCSMHAHHVSHRDLKPENMLLDSEGRLRISDFGFSAVMDSDDLLKTAVGTPEYVAPEVVSMLLSDATAYDGRKVDVWSCGVILYVMLCGCFPFASDSEMETYRLILACKVVYPSFISSEVRDLLSHIFVPEPSDRFSTSDIVQHPWFQEGLEIEVEEELLVASSAPTELPLPNIDGTMSMPSSEGFSQGVPDFASIGSTRETEPDLEGAPQTVTEPKANESEQNDVSNEKKVVVEKEKEKEKTPLRSGHALPHIRIAEPERVESSNSARKLLPPASPAYKPQQGKMVGMVALRRMRYLFGLQSKSSDKTSFLSLSEEQVLWDAIKEAVSEKATCHILEEQQAARVLKCSDAASRVFFSVEVHKLAPNVRMVHFVRRKGDSTRFNERFRICREVLRPHVVKLEDFEEQPDILSPSPSK